MEYFGYFSSACILLGLIQLLNGASVDDKYEPMVAFICDRPAMHRGVNGWIPDKFQNCPDKLEDVLAYCKKVYPDHNITNVVESSRLYDIPNWPMGNAGREHSHHVRPFRCLVGGFQSDALLVPQHCEFDHRHDINQCKEFSHWNRVADEACKKKTPKMHLESFGMLLYCRNLVGHFNGVEYVCCPNESETHVQPDPAKDDDKPDKLTEGGDESSKSGSDEDEDYQEVSASVEDSNTVSAPVDSNELPDENAADLYEAYLRGLPFPEIYDNEHKKYLAAKERMKQNQKKKVAKLLQEWEKAREHVNEVRKTDPKSANKMNDEIAMRFKHLYASFKQEDAAEKQQLIALHQQHIQALLNEKKREAMDKYMQALETGDIDKIVKYLHNYIKAEEKDRMHTVNHFEHIRWSAPKEALRIHRHIINHLKLSELRIDQALEMLTHYPQVETQVRPEIEEFMKRFDGIAKSIKEVVIPVPQIPEDDSEEEDKDEDSNTDSTNDINIDDSTSNFDSSSEETDISSQQTQDSNKNVVVDDEVQEDEHSYERNNHFAANAMENSHSAHQNLGTSAVTHSNQIGSTVGIALGSVSMFVIIVVAVMMIHRKRNSQSVAQGYVEVDPSASPEDRHLANMQMNGYENPTYKYFEVQNNPKA